MLFFAVLGRVGRSIFGKPGELIKWNVRFFWPEGTGDSSSLRHQNRVDSRYPMTALVYTHSVSRIECTERLLEMILCIRATAVYHRKNAQYANRCVSHVFTCLDNSVARCQSPPIPASLARTQGWITVLPGVRVLTYQLR